MSAVWFLMVDVWLIIYMRDSVILFFNVFLKNKSIIDWQVDGVKIAKAQFDQRGSYTKLLHQS